MEKFEKTSQILKTLDGNDIAANLYSPVNLGDAPLIGGIVFSHMMPSTKESWDLLAIRLAELGYLGIAIDLRGHGASSGGPKSYAKFTDEEHQKSILDLDAASKFLMGKGLKSDEISFIGASIGANLSLKYIADNQDYKTAILLSPGLDYRGIKSELLAATLSDGQRVFIVSSRDDDGNAEESRAIFSIIKNGIEKRLEIFENGGHGTDLLDNHPNLSEMIIEFIANN